MRLTQHASPGQGRGWFRRAGRGAAFLLAVMALVPHVALGGENPALDAAIRAYITQRLALPYAGDCRAARLPEDVGKVCSSVQLPSPGVARSRWA